MATKSYDGSSTQEISFTADLAGNLLQVSNIDGWSEYRSGDDLIIFSSDKTNYLRVIGAYASATKLDFIEYFFDGKSSGEIRSVSTISPTPVSGLHFIAGTFENDTIDGASASSLSATGYLGDDKITGTVGRDYLGGNEGNDTIIGLDGNDVLLGGAGDDIINGGDGDDYLYGGDGDDVIVANGGHNEIYAGAGDDEIRFEALNADSNTRGRYISEEGNDHIDLLGASWVDIRFDETSTTHNTLINFTENERTIEGVTLGSYSARDQLGYVDTYGGIANGAYFVGTYMDDIAFFDKDFKWAITTGNDEITILTDNVSGILEGDGWNAYEDVGLDWDINSSTFDYVGEDGQSYTITVNGTLTGLRGSMNNDILRGGAGDDIINGGNGDDTLNGGEGDDTINGGDGDDTLDGGEGDDIYEYWGYEGIDIITEASGFDTIVFKEDHNINAGWGSPFRDGNDLVYLANNEISGFRVVDHFVDANKSIEAFEYEGAGYTILIRNSDIPINSSEFSELIVGTIGNDTLIGASSATGNFSEIYGYEGDDYIDNSNGIKSWIEAGDGSDTIIGSAFTDRIRGQGEKDIIHGNDGDDTLHGGNGDDALFGGNGNDDLDGGSGVNRLEGGEGNDTYSFAYNGADTISDSGGNNDTLYLIARNADDTPYFGDAYVENDKLIFVSSKNSSHTLTIEDAFSAAGRIEKITFHAESGRWSDYTLRIASVDDNIDGSDISYWGTHSDDVIQMNDGYNEAYSSIGNDTILAGDGGSWISAGEGDDKIVGGIGVDYIVADNFYTANTGADLISGGGGDDVIHLAASKAYSRWLSAKNVSSEFQTGTQELINLKNFLKTEDVVDGGADADTIHLDSGNIALFLHDAFSAFHEEASLSKDSYGNKSVQRIDNIENIYGYDGDNLIDLTSPDYSMAGQNIKISGGNGDDIIWGSNADENILGDAGNDVLFGGAGTNILTGGSGADEFQFTHTSIADTISDYSKADGDVLKFYVRSGAPEATAEFSITGNQLVWGDISITLDGYTNLSGNDLTIKKQIIGSTLLEDVLITELPPSLSISLSKDAKTFIADGLNAERDVQIVSEKLSGFYKGINGANAIFRTLENETVTKQDAVTVSNQGIFITSDAGYMLSLEFTNFSPSSLNQLQTMFENANDINDINLTGGFQRITLADPDGSTLLKLNHSSSGITWENPNADAGVVDTFMIKGSFENQIKDYIDFIKNVDAAANTQQSPSNLMNFVEEVNSLIQLDGISATSDGKTVFDFTAKEDGTLTLTLMGTGGDHVLEFGLGLDGIEKIGTDIIALAGGEDAFFNMLIEDQMSNNIQQYLSDISNLDEIELTLGYDFANKELIDIKLTDFSRLDSLNVDPFILKDLKIFDSSTDELRITTVANPTGEVVINLVGYNQYEVSSAIETVSSYAYNDFGILLEELFIPDQNLLML